MEPIRIGEKSSRVVEIQDMLRRNNYNIASDGIFGTQTKESIIDFQRKQGLDIDGVVGNKTYASLKNPNKTAMLGETVSAHETRKNLLNNTAEKADEEMISLFTTSAIDLFKTFNMILLDVLVEETRLKKLADVDVKRWNSFVQKLYERIIIAKANADARMKPKLEQIKKELNRKRKAKSGKSATQSRIALQKNEVVQIVKQLKADSKRILKLKINSSFIRRNAHSGNTFKYAGKAVGIAATATELGIALKPLFIDFNNMGTEADWRKNWERDLENFFKVLLGILIAALVVLFLPEEIGLLALIGICMLVGIIFEIIFNWLMDSTPIGEVVKESCNIWGEIVNGLKLKFNLS